MQDRAAYDRLPDFFCAISAVSHFVIAF